MKNNVVIILADALRQDRIGYLGDKDITPNIDNLASKSTVFNNAFTVSNATDPAVRSINTGLYPLGHGIVNHGFRVTQEEKKKVEGVPWLPQILSKEGYSTAKFGRPLGRWHRRGFDKYPEISERRKAFDNKKWKVKHKIKSSVKSLLKTSEKFFDLSRYIYNHLSPDTSIKGESSGDGVVDDFRGFISKNEGPFFSFVHLMDTHTPYNGSPDLVKKYLEDFQYDVKKVEGISGKIPKEFNNLVLKNSFSEIKEKYYFEDGNPSTAVVDAHYDAAVSRTDRRVGKILDCLKEQGVFKDTLIIFLSDHGESLTEHGIYYDHHGLYDVSVRIPLIIHFPDKKGKEIEDLVQVTDILPTVLDFLGLKNSNIETNSDGISLLQMIKNHSSDMRDILLAEEAHTQRRRMIRTDEEKAIYLVDGNTICRYCNVQHAPKKELYNLEDDPHELENLARRNKEQVENLISISEKKIDPIKEPDLDHKKEVKYEDEEEIHQRLKDLGYK